MSTTTVLAQGATGEAVRDLQQRLGALGFDTLADEVGVFGAATEAAVRAFQEARGLRVDAVCGPETWSALVESGFELGDRLLYFRRPMLRGDDVVTFQERLNALGFDAGREDGIFGEETGRAVTEFQRNAGLATDGICGPATLASLARVGSLAGGSVAMVREREALRQGPRTLAGRRMFVAVAPEFAALNKFLVRGLADAGAHVVSDTSGASDSAVAAEANRYDAELFVALRRGDTSECQCFYFATARFRSEAGIRLAAAVQEEFTRLGIAAGAEPCGKSFALLRETRMPAVVCEVAPSDDVEAMRFVVGQGGPLARAIVRGIRRAVERADEEPGQ